MSDKYQCAPEISRTALKQVQSRYRGRKAQVKDDRWTHPASGCVGYAWPLGAGRWAFQPHIPAEPAAAYVMDEMFLTFLDHT